MKPLLKQIARRSRVKYKKADVETKIKKNQKKKKPQTQFKNGQRTQRGISPKIYKCQ